MSAHSPTKRVPSRNHARQTEAPRRRMSSRRPRSSGAAKRPPAVDPALAYWLGTFHRYHTDGVTSIPLALRMVSASGSAGGPGSPSLPNGRHAIEVAECRGVEGEHWMLIVWDIDVPGMRFVDCASAQEAMTLYERSDVLTMPTTGVRLRASARPW